MLLRERGPGDNLEIAERARGAVGDSKEDQGRGYFC